MTTEKRKMTIEDMAKSQKLAKYLAEQITTYMSLFVEEGSQIGWIPVSLASFTTSVLHSNIPSSVSWEEFFSNYLEIMQQSKDFAGEEDADKA